jgi:hypothetical protein
MDEIRLTLPRELRFYGAARLVVGGLAARLDLSYETLDDLQLAAEAVLMAELDAPGVEINVELDILESAVKMTIGPLGTLSSVDGPRAGEGLDLPALLGVLVDAFGVVERGSDRWLALEKKLPPRPVPVG